jgi:hypothetical protein
MDTPEGAQKLLKVFRGEKPKLSKGDRQILREKGKMLLKVEKVAAKVDQYQ